MTFFMILALFKKLNLKIKYIYESVCMYVSVSVCVYA